MSNEFPYLPYGDTSGWSGSQTSQARAIAEDSDGTTSFRQKIIVALLLRAGKIGLTWKEVAERQNWHHGQSSGALSVLHKEGLIERLTERRNRCAVYVHPDFVNGRDTAPHGRKKRIHTCTNCGHTEES